MNSRTTLILLFLIILSFSIVLTACERGESPVYNHLHNYSFGHDIVDNSTNASLNTTGNITSDADSETGSVYEHLQHNLG